MYECRKSSTPELLFGVVVSFKTKNKQNKHEISEACQ